MLSNVLLRSMMSRKMMFCVVMFCCVLLVHRTFRQLMFGLRRRTVRVRMGVQVRAMEMYVRMGRVRWRVGW